MYKKEYSVRLTTEDMDIITVALKYFYCCEKSTEDMRKSALEKIMNKENEIYTEMEKEIKEKSQRS